MNTIDFIREKAAYNQWANHRIIEWLQQQSEALYEIKVISSFPTINKLLLHIMETEKYYFSIILQKEESYPKEMRTDKIFDQLKKIDLSILHWLSLQEDVDINKTISLKRSPFVETYTIATIITHLINHSTYHRGQLVALRHQLGMSDAPKTDYYRFMIARSAEF